MAPPIKKVIERCERSWITGSRSELLTGARIHAIVEGELEHLREVEVAGEDERFLAEGARFDTTGGASLASVLHRLALAHQLLNYCVGVEDRRKAVSFANDLQRRLEKAIGVGPRELDVV